MRNQAKRFVLAAAVSVAAAGIFGARPARAALETWDGGGTDDNLNTGANWADNTAPNLTGANDDLHFAGGVRTTPVVNGNFQALSVSFDAGASAFTIGTSAAANTFTIAGTGTAATAVAIVNNSSVTQTFNVDTRVRAGIIRAATADLVFASVFGVGNTPNSTSGANRQNVFDGAFNIYMNGVVTLKGGNNGTTTPGLVKNGTGTLFLTNDGNEFNSQLLINGGAVQINVANALGLIPNVARSTVYYNGTAIGAGTTTGDNGTVPANTVIAGGTNTGVLRLSDVNPNTQVASGGVVFAAEPLVFNGRTGQSAHLANASGNNIWTGPITLTTGGDQYAIESNGGNLTVQSTITNTSGNASARALWLQGNGNGIVSGVIGNNVASTGALSVNKAGSGTWTLSGVNTYTGATNVNGGTLQIDSAGSIVPSAAINVTGAGSKLKLASAAQFTNTVPVTLASGGTLDLSALGGYTMGAAQVIQGSGSVLGAVSANAGNTVRPGTAGGSGTLAFSDALSLSGATLPFDLTINPSTAGSGVNDYITAGNLNLAGTNTIALNLVNNVLGAGTYNLITYTGSKSGGLGNLALTGTGTTRQVIQLVDDTVNKQINLDVSGTSANLIWSGASGPAWDLVTTKNFTNAAVADFYYDLDAVSFLDGGAPNVTLASTLTPASVTVNASQNYTFAGPGAISGSGNLAKSGTGTLVLANAGNNSYSGGTTISGGVLQVGDGTASGGLGAGPVVNNASLVFNRAGTLTVPGAISGAGSVTMSGTGQVTLGGANSYAGATTVSSGTLAVTATGGLGTAAAGTIVAPGARLYLIGNTDVSGDALTVGGNFDGAAANGALQAGGGTSAAVTTTATAGAVTLTGNTTLAADAFSFLNTGTVTGNNVNLTLAGAATGGGGLGAVSLGTGSLNATGGAWTLNAANTYDGATTVATGALLNLRNAAALGTAAAGTTVADGGQVYTTVAMTLSEPLTIAGLGAGGTTGALRSGGSALTTFAGPVALTGNTAFFVDGGAQMNFTNAVTGANTNLTLRGDAGTGRLLGSLNVGTGSITVDGLATWIIGTDAVTYGATTVNATATLRVGNGAAAGNLGTGTVTNNGALQFNRSDAYTYAGVISGTGTVTQGPDDAVNPGTLTLSAANTYTGQTVVSRGSLRITNASALGTTVGNTLIDSSGFGGQFKTGSLVFAGGISVAEPIFMRGRPGLAGATTVAYQISNESGNNTLTGPIDFDTGGSFYGVRSDAGKLTLAGPVTNRTGVATERTIVLGGAGDGEITGAISNGTNPTSGVLSSGPINLIKEGAGTWFLNVNENSTDNNVTGNVTVRGGTLFLRSPDGTTGELRGRGPNGDLATTITVGAGGTLDISTFTEYSLQISQGLAGSGNVKGSAGTTLKAYFDTPFTPGGVGGTGTLTFDSNVSLNSDGTAGQQLHFELGSAGQDKIVVNGNLIAQADVTLNVASLGAIAAGNYDLITASTISGPGQFLVNNTTRYTLSPASVIDGPSADVVRIAVSGSSSNLTWSGTGNTWNVIGAANWTGGAGGDNRFYNADSVTFSDAGIAQPTVDLTATVYPSAVTFNHTSTTTAYTVQGAGSIAGTTGITKAGAGTVVLSTNNSFTGAVNVTAGTLRLGNANALGATNAGTTVSAGATLDFGGVQTSEPVTVSGAGVDGLGALVSSVAGSGGGTARATNSITLAGDTTIGGTQRWDLRYQTAGDAVLNANGFSLTKVGTNEVWLVTPAVSNLADVNINQGTLGFQSMTSAGDPNKTVTVAAGATLGLWAEVVADGQAYTKKWAVNGGSISVGNGPATLNGPMTISAPSTLNVNGTSVALTITGPVTGAGGFTKTGTGPLTLTNSVALAASATVSAGTVTINGPFSAPALSVATGATVNGTGTLNIALVGDAVGTTITNAGTFDISGLNLALSLSGTHTASEYVLANNTGGTLLGGAFASVLGLPSGASLDYDGTATHPNSIVLLLANILLPGDVNSDGFVNQLDLNIVGANWLASGATLAQGDANGDTFVNQLDLNMIGANWLAQASSVSALSAVPEPASLAAIATALMPALARRRRHNHAGR